MSGGAYLPPGMRNTGSAMTSKSMAFDDYLARLRARLSGEAGGQRRVVAFFDLDRTLIDGYSLTALAWQQLFNGDLSLRRVISLGAMFLGYGLGRKDYAEMLQATVNDIRGMTEEALYALGRQAYEERLASWIYREGFELVATHRELGHDVVMVTSATRYQAAPVIDALGFDEVACTELEIVDGRIAGGVRACYGPGKLDAAQRYVGAVGAELSDAYFYSDSPDDLPLLEGVGNPVVVNGKAKLVKIGTGRGWPTLEFQETGWATPRAA